MPLCESCPGAEAAGQVVAGLQKKHLAPPPATGDGGSNKWMFGSLVAFYAALIVAQILSSRG